MSGIVLRLKIRLIANEFAEGIGNSCNDPLSMNSARETLCRSCCKRRLQQGDNSYKSWLALLVNDIFIFGNNIIKIFL